jgi:16S rRNA A1518/A1519 N6-dimethyltransferase RsmA/KsgA/DIM1 with predicted DNA glycosylase/AP lyase activity
MSADAASSPGGSSFEFEALQAARNYRTALVREFAPELNGLVLEVGAGIGQITRELRSHPKGRSLVAVEPEPLRVLHSFNRRL